MNLNKIFSLCFALLISSGTYAQYKIYEAGLAEYKNQKFDKAIAHFNDYFTKSGRDKKIDLESYYYRGLSYYKKSDYSNAIKDFKECISLGHTNAGNIHWFMAKGYSNLNQWNDAVTQYTAALNILGKDDNAKVKLLFERGQSYLKLGNSTSALEDLIAANAINPDDQSILAELTKLKPDAKPQTETETQRQAVAQNEQKNETVKKPVEEKPKQQEATKPVANNTLPAANQPVTTPPVTTPVVVANPLAEKYAGEKRYALVIGNANYPKNIGALRNPINDAKDVSEELKKSGFEVDLLTDATYIQMREAMRKFHNKLINGPKDQTVGLFYFAGHGVQYEDENYLVPLDANVEFEEDIARMCFPVQKMVLASMERSNSRMNILVLDACRNNPFPAASRSVSQGLVEMKRARGSFIAYATAPGSVASDGPGRNGLYTQELLKAMRQPGLTIEQVFKEVRANVGHLSGNKQNTWDSSNIIGDFYFKFN